MKNRGGQFKRDPVTIAEAIECYDQQKPNAGNRITLGIVAKRFGIKDYGLINARRRLSPKHELQSNVARVSKENPESCVRG